MAVRLSFRCLCGEHLTVGESEPGTMLTCPRCKRSLRAPRLRAENGRSTIRCTCPSCGRRISAPTETQGQEMACPTCHVRVEIPTVLPDGLAPAPAAEPSLSLEDEAGAPEAKPAAPPAPDAPGPSINDELLALMNAKERRHEAAAKAEVGILYAGVAGGALGILGAFLPWASLPDGGALSFVRLMGSANLRALAPGWAPMGIFFSIWGLLTMLLAVKSPHAVARTKWLWGFFLAAVLAMLGAWRSCTVAGALTPGDLFRSLSLGAWTLLLAVLTTGVAGVVSAVRERSTLRWLALCGGTGILLAAGLCALTSGGSGGRVALSVQTDDKTRNSKGEPQIAVTVTLTNPGDRPALLAPVAPSPAPGRTSAVYQRYRFVLLHRTGPDKWQEMALPASAGPVVLPPRLKPRESFKFKFALAPLWDLTAPGTEAIHPPLESQAGTYRCLLDHPDSARRVNADFEARALPHPEARAALEYAKAEEEEKLGRLVEADQAYAAIPTHSPNTATAKLARQARERLAPKVKEQQAQRLVAAALAEAGLLEQAGRLGDALERLTTLKLPAASPYAEDVRQTQERLAAALKAQEQQEYDLLRQGVETAWNNADYLKVIDGCARLIARFPNTAAGKDALLLRDKAVERRAEQVAEPELARLDERLKQGDMAGALVAIRDIEQRAAQNARAGKPIEQRVAALFQTRRQKIEKEFSELTCRKRAELLQRHLSDEGTRIEPLRRVALEEEAERYAAREKRAAEIEEGMRKAATETDPWFMAAGALLYNFPDTEVASARQSLRKAVDEWFKRHPDARKKLPTP